MNHVGEPFPFSCFPVPGFNGHLYIPEDDYDYYPYHYPHNDLQPHPRIRELAEEVRALFFHYMENETNSVAPPTFCFLSFFFFLQEAEKHTQELIEEEERCKEKTEKNRRKKLVSHDKWIRKKLLESVIFWVRDKFSVRCSVKRKSG